MEQIVPGTLVDLAKGGAGWALFVIMCFVVRYQNGIILDVTQKYTEAITRIIDQNKELLTVQRERVLAEKDTASAMQVLAKQIENSIAATRDAIAAAKERAEDIKRFIVKDRET